MSVPDAAPGPEPAVPTLVVTLRKGKEKAARARHPWVFSGAVEPLPPATRPGAAADLQDAGAEFVARGYVNPNSQILFRALTHRREPVDLGFFRRRVEDAAELRRRLVEAAEPETDAWRVIHGEGDGLAGLVVDRYGDVLVCQFLSAGMDVRREAVLDALEAVLQPRGIWERSEGPGRREEGLDARRALARGVAPPERIEVRERGARFLVDVRAGYKTGFYLDQRPARAAVRELARGAARVLDVFAYTGGFAVNAALGGAAEIEAIDASETALGEIRQNFERNGLDPGKLKLRPGDAFEVLRQGTSSFDLVVLDPPPFAKRKGEVEGACRGYKDLNLHAMKRLRPGGMLVTSSCSHHVDPWLFQQVLFGAARDAGASMQLVRRLGAGPDHPVSIYHPEGEYLKTFVLRKAG